MVSFDRKSNDSTMSCMSVSDKYIAIAKGLLIDLYDYTNHIIIKVPSTADHDQINGLAISACSKYLAVTINLAKQLLVYDLPTATDYKVFELSRSSSKMKFAFNSHNIFLADKSGDVLSFDINTPCTDNSIKGKKMFGHLSIILDILLVSNGKYVITSDRDEKVRVTCYPNTYEIQTYCLGHKEYVNHLRELPHDMRYLLTSSGDGTLRIWDYVDGKNCITIDTYNDINETQLKDKFKNKMDEDGVQVDSLPIIHLAATKLNSNCSIIAISIHTYEMILIYRVLNSADGKITHKLETGLKTDGFPTDIEFHNSTLLIYNDKKNDIVFYNVLYSNGTVSFDKSKVEHVFESTDVCKDNVNGYNHFEAIKLLFKRKFDNVQEYQERKKQRLEKSAIKKSD